MLTLQPILEQNASEEIKIVYRSIKQTLGVLSVPLIFQYIAGFPSYFHHIWEQTSSNLTDAQYKTYADEIYRFAQNAIDEIYTPSLPTQLIKESIARSAERYTLNQFINQSVYVHSNLYLISLAIRESVKGSYYGLKQIPKHVSLDETTIFTDITEGFPLQEESSQQGSLPASYMLSKKETTSLATSFTEKYFECIHHEMDNLIKTEEYLTRRVALERFTVTKLPLLPFPLDSSIKTIFAKTPSDSNYPELLYLLAELFPTQAPYKLMATAVMRKTLQ